MQTLVGKSIGKYQIIQFIGQKNQSSRYVAVNQNEKKKVVIRFYFPQEGFSEGQRRDALSACEALLGIEHPSIVGIIEYNMAGRIPYLVMPYVSAESLQQHLTKPMPWRAAVRLLAPIARALAYAHSHLQPHGSISPNNIYWTEKGLVLADLGHSHLLDLMRNTQVDSSDPPFDPHRDIHDLGNVLEAMLTIRNPAEPHHAGSLPEQVQRVIHKASSDNPQQAYASMADFARELEELVGIKPPENDTSRRIAELAPVSPAAGRSVRRKNRSTAWSLLLPVLLLAIALALWIVKPFDFLQTSSDPGIAVQNPAGPSDHGNAAVLSADTYTQSAVPTDPILQTAQPGIETQTTVLPSGAAEESPGTGSILISPVDGMRLLYVPASEFWMGSDDRDIDEQPQHRVYLDAFWIDETEVTNGMYAACVAADICTPPVTVASSTRDAYFDNPDFDNYPVVYVTWSQARDYCTWSGRRLPTEAEWEKAARGDDGRICPWGNQAPGESLLNYDMLFSDTTPVGSFPGGVSPYGALDMAGNVWEWVFDWYDSRYYQDSPADNPTGPDSGSRHVLRGGSWYYDLNYIRAAFRFRANASTTLNDVGFRCALTP